MYKKPELLLSRALLLILSLGGIWLFFRFVLPWTAPLMLAYAAAAVLEKPARALCARGLSRPAASGACLLAALALAALAVKITASRLYREALHLGRRLPELADALSELLESWQQRFGGFAERLPPSLTQVLDSAAEGLTEYIYSLPGKVSARAMELLTDFIGNLPTWLLFTVTWIMGIYFISSAYPRILAFIRRQIPETFFIRLLGIKAALGQSLGKYLKAQLIMSAITFGEMLAVFIFLGVDSPLIMAFVVAVIDALPVFGAGTVLVPWTIWEFIAGDAGLALGLAISYGGATIIRSCIQAKLLGDQLGLHPIATLLAIYAGWKAWGVKGMILFPIAAISIKKLNDSGIIHLYKGEEHDRNNIQHNSGHGNEHSGRNEYPSG